MKGRIKMQLLFLVIKRIELVDEIMRSLAQAGIRGGTVIDSVGMARTLHRRARQFSLPLQTIR